MSWREFTANARSARQAAFGTALLYTPLGASSAVSTTPEGAPLLGTFSSSYSRPDPNGGGLTVISERPNVTLSRSDLPVGCAALARRRGDELEFAGDDNAPPEHAGARYIVDEVLVDSRGGVRLVLQELIA